MRGFADSGEWYDGPMNMKRFTAATIITTAGFGLAGLGVAGLAEAAPVAPLPDYHWCPGQFFDPHWGPTGTQGAATTTTTSTANLTTGATGTAWAPGARNRPHP